MSWKGIVFVVAVFAAWLVLNRWVLPHFGVATCCCPVVPSQTASCPLPPSETVKQPTQAEEANLNNEASKEDANEIEEGGER